MKLDINEHEKTQLVDAINLAITSAARAQKGKSPQISAVYAIVERDLAALKLKIQDTK